MTNNIFTQFIKKLGVAYATMTGNENFFINNTQIIDANTVEAKNTKQVINKLPKHINI